MSSLTKEEAFTNLWKGVTDIVVARLHQAREYVVEEEAKDPRDQYSLDSWLLAENRYRNMLTRLATAVVSQDFDLVVSIFLKATGDNHTITDLVFQMMWFQTNDVTFV